MQKIKITFFRNHSQIKNFLLLILGISISGLLAGCRNNNSLEQIVVLNKLQWCEEQNLHYSVDNVLSLKSKLHKDDIILPVLASSIDTRKNNILLFPALSLHRIRITIEGYPKEGSRWSTDGCEGVKTFVVLKILNTEIVDSLYAFPIN